MLRPCLAAFVLGLAACGNDAPFGAHGKTTASQVVAATNSADDAVQPGLSVADEDQRPTCDAAHEYWLVYAVASQVHAVCTHGTYVTVTISN